MTKTRHRVLVVDDSPSFRGLMAAIVARAPDLALAGTAESAEEAWLKVVSLDPDVVTLDLELPGRDGFALLERIMRETPRPVLMVCGRPRDAGRAEARAFELGASGILLKPGSTGEGTETFLRQLVDSIRRAAGSGQKSQAAPALHNQTAPAQPISAPPRTPAPVTPAAVGRTRLAPDQPVVAIGASTGGVEAVSVVLSAIARARPAILVVQHILPGYGARFAARLATVTGLRSVEAREGIDVEPGLIIVGADRVHMTLEQRAGRLCVRLQDGAPVSGHCPSIDVMSRSLAQIGRPVIAALLTGMGRDGAQGLLALRQAGAHTIAQDEATSTVYGMPGVAAELGAARRILPLDAIGSEILARLDHAGPELARAAGPARLRAAP